jgi:DNA-binding CsgD family transcriptional regulator
MLDLGILVTGRDGRIVFSNRAAEMLLRLRKDSRAGSDAIDQRQITAPLDRQIRAVIRRGQGRTEGHIATTTFRGHPLFLLVARCGAANDAMDIVFVSESVRHLRHDLSAIAPLFALSRAETRLLHALLRGDTIAAYAKHADITLNTAKGYLKELFRKTSTGRQSDLVRLILANPILHLVLRDAAIRRQHDAQPP